MDEITLPIYGQQCQDPELTRKFRDFHVEIVEKIIRFLNENHISVDEFNLHADGLRPSIEHGVWTPYTDSEFEIDNYNEETPYLFSA